MVQVAFYKSKTRLFNRLIAWWTRGPYSHCELVVGGRAFSSSIMDGGIRAKRIDFNPAHWDIVDVPWADADAAVAWFEANISKDYDVLGLLGFIIRRVEGAECFGQVPRVCAIAVPIVGLFRAPLHGCPLNLRRRHQLFTHRRPPCRAR